MEIGFKFSLVFVSLLILEDGRISIITILILK